MKTGAIIQSTKMQAKQSVQKFSPQTNIFPEDRTRSSHVAIVNLQSRRHGLFLWCFGMRRRRLKPFRYGGNDIPTTIYRATSKIAPNSLR